MGRSYWFECSKCGYRANVSGRAERSVHFSTQTVSCRDCKKLYDVVTRLRVPDIQKKQNLTLTLRPGNLMAKAKVPTTAPTFDAVLNRLPFKGIKYFRWLRFTPQCPISSYHRVQEWTAPGKCPRCGTFLDQGGLPFRMWD